MRTVYNWTNYLVDEVESINLAGVGKWQHGLSRKVRASRPVNGNVILYKVYNYESTELRLLKVIKKT